VLAVSSSVQPMAPLGCSRSTSLITLEQDDQRQVLRQGTILTGTTTYGNQVAPRFHNLCERLANLCKLFPSE
jgi:hypothetical protein